MSQINVSNLTFSYDTSGDNIFENVSFQFDTDWKLGFIGRNGRGKTSFLKLLMGQYEYSGTIQSSVLFSYFPFPVVSLERNTLEIVDEINPDYEFWQLCRELNYLNVSEDVLFRPFETLSYGEQTKVQIAALFLRKNHFLLLDEPTNHLDDSGKEVLSKYLQSKKSFLLVSHDRILLDQTVDHILSINKTNIEIQKGGFSQWLSNKEQQDQNEEKENQKLKKEISKLQVAAKRTSSWSDKVESTKIGCGVADRGAVGHKAAKMMKRSKVLETRQNAAIAQKSSLLKNIEKQAPLKLSPLVYHSSVPAELSELSITYENRTILRGINLTIKQGERIALKGKNGCGKSSLLKLLVGQNIPHTGHCMVKNDVKISYVPQGTSSLSGDLRAFAEAASIDLTLFLTILRKLGFERVQFEKEMQHLSEGQKKKVLIARSLSESAHLYLWDEPLNYMDIQSRMQIEELLIQSSPTMVFVEHDEMFVQKIATREFVLPPNV